MLHSQMDCWINYRNAKDKVFSNKDVQVSHIDHDQQISYIMKKTEYNEAMAQNTLKHSFDEIDNQDEHDINPRNCFVHEKMNCWNKQLINSLLQSIHKMSSLNFK